MLSFVTISTNLVNYTSLSNLSNVERKVIVMNITKNVLQNPYTKKILLPLVATASLLGGVTLYNNTQKTDVFERTESSIEKLREISNNWAEHDSICNEILEEIKEGKISHEEMVRYHEEKMRDLKEMKK